MLILYALYYPYPKVCCSRAYLIDFWAGVIAGYYCGAVSEPSDPLESTVDLRRILSVSNEVIFIQEYYASTIRVIHVVFSVYDVLEVPAALVGKYNTAIVSILFFEGYS